MTHQRMKRAGGGSASDDAAVLEMADIEVPDVSAQLERLSEAAKTAKDEKNKERREKRKRDKEREERMRCCGIRL